MEKDGLVERNVFAEAPPKVVYRLTASAKGLISIWDKLNVWGNNHRAIIEALD